MTQVALWAVVPAAGSGSRFAASQAKQYIDLAGKTIAERSLATLESAGIFQSIVVVLNPLDKKFSQLPQSQNPIFELAEGGQSRAESVLNGLKALADRAKADDWVMVHDIARPLITEQSLHTLWAAVNDVKQKTVGAILAAPIYDTVKQAEGTTQADAEQTLPTIAKTLDRHLLWSAQTPQLFPYGLLCQALSGAMQSPDAAAITDEASAIERIGGKVLIVKNSRQNIKITTAEDLQLANYYLSQNDTPN